MPAANPDTERYTLTLTGLTRTQLKRLERALVFEQQRTTVAAREKFRQWPVREHAHVRQMLDEATAEIDALHEQLAAQFPGLHTVIATL